jgi:two-component sensor histidine kinase
MGRLARFGRTVGNGVGLSVKAADHQRNGKDNHRFCNVKPKCPLYEFENDVGFCHNLLSFGCNSTHNLYVCSAFRKIFSAQKLFFSPLHAARRSIGEKRLHPGKSQQYCPDRITTRRFEDGQRRELMAAEDDLRLEVENADLRRLVAQAGLDAADQIVAQRLQRLVLEELHHRIKNTLAIVMAIVTQSLRTAKNVNEGREAIEHRLVALGRVHDLLLQSNWTSAKLAEILKAATDPFDRDNTSSRFTVQSSNIDVSPAAVLPLAMVPNELCTNATKYGALSNATGHVSITSSIDDSQRLFRLKWVESGGPTVTTPTRRSFGSRLIEHSFVRQLQGEAQLTFAPSGVVCVLDIPLAALKQPQSN